MRRYEALQEIMKAITDEPVVCNLGHPAQELFAVRDRPQNFYMLGSMGLASSIAHGLALCRSGKVVAIDGDASVTMNLGGFATIGHTRPKKSGADHHRQRGEWVDRLSAIFHGRKLATRSDCAGCRNYSGHGRHGPEGCRADRCGGSRGRSGTVRDRYTHRGRHAGQYRRHSSRCDRDPRSFCTQPWRSSRQSDVIILEEQGIWSTKPAFARFTVV